jgi:hypothetical protein
MASYGYNFEFKLEFTTPTGWCLRSFSFNVKFYIEEDKIFDREKEKGKGGLKVCQSYLISCVYYAHFSAHLRNIKGLPSQSQK